MNRHELETVARIAQEFPNWAPMKIVALYEAIRRDARKIQRLAECACNHELSEWNQKRYADAQRRIRDRWIGPGVDFSGDPRGYVVKLILPSGASNNMGGEGWGIA